MRIVELLQGKISRVWQGLREWSGDAAYEIYLRSAMRSKDRGVLTEEEFYVEQLNRKYSKPNRCC
jgi:uncharacterized short protein YbdD (DUF466 family)